MSCGKWRALLLSGVLACGTTHPGIAFGENTPDDLHVLVNDTWDRFIEVFPAHLDCLGRVTVAGAWELDERATYEPGTAAITLRIPATAAKLETALLHELGHHLEFSCSSHQDIRAAFLVAQGFPGGAEWFNAENWEETPSEQFAEAVIEAVLGSRNVRYGILIKTEAIELIRQWGIG